MTKGIFITATGTDAGKTYVTALIVKKLREGGFSAGYYKAALSGAEPSRQGLIPGDAEYVCRAARISGQASRFVTEIYEDAVSPHLAARQEGHPLSLEKAGAHMKSLCKEYDYLTIEGSGGIICPLVEQGGTALFLEDIIRLAGVPLLIVAPAGLGTINSTLLTVSYARARGLTVKGIVLNHWKGGTMEEDNVRMIEKYGAVPVLARIADWENDFPQSAEKLAHWYEGMCMQ